MISRPGYWTCEPQWTGETAFIIAGGPSVLGQNLETLRGRKVIAINSSVYAVPWADFLFFGDPRWYTLHWQTVENFAGIAVTTVVTCKSSTVRKMIPRPPPGLATNRQWLTWRFTALISAINLAVHLGATTIVLLGADGKRAADGRCHHHKPHPWPVQKGCWDRHKKVLATLVEPLQALGITVWNASPGSAWADLWPVTDLATALGREAGSKKVNGMARAFEALVDFNWGDHHFIKGRSYAFEDGGLVDQWINEQKVALHKPAATTIPPTPPRKIVPKPGARPLRRR
jgi:hypothetical protein